jgi:hypothetical protein
MKDLIVFKGKRYNKQLADYKEECKTCDICKELSIGHVCPVLTCVNYNYKRVIKLSAPNLIHSVDAQIHNSMINIFGSGALVSKEDILNYYLTPKKKSIKFTRIGYTCSISVTAEQLVALNDLQLLEKIHWLSNIKYEGDELKVYFEVDSGSIGFAKKKINEIIERVDSDNEFNRIKRRG